MFRTLERISNLTIAQKKHRHVSLVDQKDAPSSRENSTPPDIEKGDGGEDGDEEIHQRRWKEKMKMRGEERIEL